MKENQQNCCTPIGQIKRYVDCKDCDEKPTEKIINQTAVQFLFENLSNKNRKKSIEELFNEALEIETKQIIDAYDWGENSSDTRFPSYLDGEEYYNKTFKNKL